jgi:hypothetical protein
MGRRSYARSASVILLLVSCPVFIGCAPPTPLPPNTTTISETEPNDTFAGAQPASVAVGQPVHIEGTFKGGHDLDIYSIGTYKTGDTITVDLAGQSLFGSNATIALFDQDEDVAVMDNGATSSSSSQSASLTVRKAGTYYLALAEDASMYSATYGYSALVQVNSAAVPAPAKQIVYLNYGGAPSVQIGTDVFNPVLPFSALEFGADTQNIAGRITSRVQADYAHLDIEVLSSYDVEEPSVPHSVVFVSGSRSDFYGLADDVDWYNAVATDRAVIFAGLLADDGLTTDQFVDGTANVVSHELGHLVGLAHTVDHSELMDQETPLRLLVQPQDFHRAPLAEFPVGFEDTLQLLQFALGILS